MSAPTETAQTVAPPPLLLVVDDQQTIREVARRILESQGYLVVTANNGQAAVDVVRAQPNEIALVLLDLVMPQLGGIEAAVALRAIQPGLRILLMSGDNAQQAAARCSLGEIDGFVQKPFRLQTLLGAVRAVLEGTPPATSAP